MVLATPTQRSSSSQITVDRADVEALILKQYRSQLSSLPEVDLRRILRQEAQSPATEAPSSPPYESATDESVRELNIYGTQAPETKSSGIEDEVQSANVAADGPTRVEPSSSDVRSPTRDGTTSAAINVPGPKNIGP